MILKTKKYMYNLLRNTVLSRLTALALIVILGILSGVSLLIPQQTACTRDFLAQWQHDHPVFAAVANALSLHSIFTSKLFLVCVGLFFIAMCISMYSVWKGTRSRSSNKMLQTNSNSNESFEFFSEQESIRDGILNSLQRHGYILKNQLTEKNLYAVKNELGNWGTILLHGGMLLVVAASLFHFALERRGFVQIIEGDSFFGKKDEFLVHEEGPFVGSFHPDFALGLDSVSSSCYSNGDIKSLESFVKVVDDKQNISVKSISVNQPIEVSGKTVYQSMSNGYTVALILEKDGKKIPAYFLLDRVRRFDQPYIGTSDFPVTDYLVSMKFFPNENRTSFELQNPKLLLTITQNGTTVFNGTLSPNDTINVAGNTMLFSGIRQWSGFIVTESYGVPFVFVGFGMMLVGLFFIYFLPMKEIFFSIERNEEYLKIISYGYTRREKALFADEFREIMEELYLEYGVIHVGNEFVES